MAILIVDNHDVSALHMETMVRSCFPFPVIRASDEGAAMGALARGAMEAVLFRHSPPHLNAARFSRSLVVKKNGHRIPFIAITDRFFPVLTPSLWRWNCPRVDAVVGTPATLSGLVASMEAAFARRMSACSSLAYLGKDSSVLAMLRRLEFGRKSPWKNVCYIDPAAPGAEISDIGLVLVDLCTMTQSEAEALALQLKRWGPLPLLVCIGGDSARGFPLRQYCQTYVPSPRSDDAWLRLLTELEGVRRNRWMVRVLRHHSKLAALAQDFQAMSRVASRMARLDAGSGLTQMALGEWRMAVGDAEGARNHFLASLERNPFFPKTYWRLSQAWGENAEPSDAAQWGERVASYCPNLPKLKELWSASHIRPGAR